MRIDKKTFFLSIEIGKIEHEMLTNKKQRSFFL